MIQIQRCPKTRNVPQVRHRLVLARAANHRRALPPTVQWAQTLPADNALLRSSKPRPWGSLNTRGYHEEPQWCCCWWSDSPEVEVPAGSLGVLCRVLYGRGASFVNCRAVAAVAAVAALPGSLGTTSIGVGRPWAERIALAKTQ